MNKKMVKGGLLACCCCITVLCNASRDSAQVTLEKKITKLYNKLNGEALAISNEYGEIYIHAWDKKQILVKITLTAQSATKSGAEKLLNLVTLSAARSDTAIQLSTKTGKPNTVYFQIGALQDTALNKREKKENEAHFQISSLNERCAINYTVFVPPHTPLKLTNKFGNINLGDVTGELHIDESFGQVTCNRVFGPSVLNLSVANLSVASLANAAIKATGFGTIKIDTIAGNVECGLSAGDKLEAGFVNGAYKFLLKSDNIKFVTFHLPQNFDASITAHGVFSTFSNQSSFVLTPLHLKLQGPADTAASGHPDTVPVQPGTSQGKAIDKKLLELVLQKKTQEFKGTAGEGKTTLNIAVAFSKVTFD
ncbi:MAG TPA: hypothetical protein VG738_06115 [Chitinophagaceae bacterium]|nr:hypothetical protein [Chitinophagaceae bacterium]